MRADRLVSILLLLQRRGQVTARDVAEELEVSERTARRDLEALGAAGLPVYSLPGRNGGWRLAGDGKTDLSGLSSSEIRALFLVAGTSSTTPEVRAALRKLVRALPEQFRDQAEAATSAVVVDPSGWDGGVPRRDAPVFLDEVQTAVVTRRQIRIDYVDREAKATSRIVQPLGLAAKGTVWYLVAETEKGQRTFRVDRMRAVEMLDAEVQIPDGFDLAAAWKLIADQVAERRSPFRAVAVAQHWVVGHLRYQFGTRVQIGSSTDDGRVEVAVRGSSAVSSAHELAAFGDAIEVLDPPELREHLAAIGRQLQAMYG